MSRKLSKKAKARAKASKTALLTEPQRLKELGRIPSPKSVFRPATVANAPKRDRNTIPDPNAILKSLRDLSTQVGQLSCQIQSLTKYYGGYFKDLRKEQEDLFYGKLREGLKDKRTQKAQVAYIKNIIGTKSLAPVDTEKFAKRIGGFVPINPEA